MTDVRRLKAGKHICPKCSHTRKNKRLRKPVPCATSGVMRKTPEIEPTRLAELVVYDPDTGRMMWRERPQSDFANGSLKAFGRWSTLMAGKPAFSQKDPTGYLSGQLAKQTYRAHRVAWALSYGEWPAGHIDHINGNRADNRLSNLRVVTNQDNTRNTKKGNYILDSRNGIG